MLTGAEVRTAGKEKEIYDFDARDIEIISTKRNDGNPCNTL
jgi:hypothetical protein